MTAGDVSAEYWKDNLVSPALFSQAVERALSWAPLWQAILLHQRTLPLRHPRRSLATRPSR